MKYKSLFFYFFFSIYFFFSTSCKKIIVGYVPNNRPTNFSQAFDAFWNGMNTNYVYWDIDTTNWDAMYHKYKPIFENLNLQNSNDIRNALPYFAQMTSGLIDSHCQITLYDSPAAYLIFPSLSRKSRDNNYHSSYPYMSVDINYLDSGYQIGQDYVNSNSASISLFSVCGTIKNKIIYFNCSSFHLFESYYNASAQSQTKPVLDYFFNAIKNITANHLQGIIIDLRGNLGGDLSDLNFFTGKLINKQLHFGYTRYKSGNGRLDYTPWLNANVNPSGSGNLINVPIIVLADNNTASLAELITIAIHSMPTGLFIGENTWGATGAITNNEIYNDGSFNVTGLLSVELESCEFKYLDNKIYEGIGFSPDLLVPFNKQSLDNGDDPQLDTAISKIN